MQMRMTANSCADSSILNVKEHAGATRQIVVFKSDDIVEELISQQQSSKCCLVSSRMYDSSLSSVTACITDDRKTCRTNMARKHVTFPCCGNSKEQSGRISC